MSKLNSDIVEAALTKVFAYSQGETIVKDGEELKGKKRNFIETIEMQVALKNYDPNRDKRFSGTFKLPTVPRPNMKVCVLGNAVHCEEAERIAHMNVLVCTPGRLLQHLDELDAFARSSAEDLAACVGRQVFSEHFS